MLLVIGLDGGTWSLIDPWIALGELPNLRRLRQSGVSGPLASTTPPATLPSWTSFSTGVNPGKHGVFDFTRRVPGTYDVAFVNSTYRKAPTIWAQLSAAGKRVAVLGVPGSYPPEEINGCVVSGFDTPVTTRADESFVCPSSYAALVRDAGGFPFADFQEFRVGPGWHRMARERLLEGIDKKVRLARALLARERWDCFALVFGESDTASHHFWHCADRRSPRYSAELVAEIGDALLAVYRRLDAAIGELLEVAAPDVHMLVSDHGFGGAGTKVVHLNLSLAASGFQSRQDQVPGRFVNGLKRTALTMIPADVQPRLFRMAGGRLANRLESSARFAGIEWTKTQAYSEELNYFPSVWLNLKGREPEGTVERGDYGRVCDDVSAALLNLADPTTGQRVVDRVWRREELFHGPWVGMAPDLLIEFRLDDGYSYNCLPTAVSAGRREIYQLPPQAFVGKLAGMSGSHRPDGMFLVGGDGIGVGTVAGANISDAGATVLALCGVEAAKGLDGKSLVDHRSTSEPRSAAVTIMESDYSPQEAAEIEARLGDLGYIQ